MVFIDSLISPKVQQLWNDWELRIITILSMSLQMFLMVFATHRKTTKNMWLISLVVIAHSLADWIAAYGVGLISSSQGRNSGDAVPNELLAFWAPFFLLHLGGSDTITSHSLDDDSFLIKQLVGLVSHVLAIVFIFLKSFPNKLMVPTMLVFAAGTFRNAQRVSSLLLRRHEKLKASRTTPANEDTKLLETTYSEMMKANLPKEIHRPPSPPKSRRLRPLLTVRTDGELNSFLILEYGILLYDSFKGFVKKVSVSSEERLFSREFYRNRTPKDAFKLLEVELFCMYEALYTQSLGLHSTFQLLFPSYNMLLVFISIVIFGIVEKHEWHKFDIGLTYLLLTAAHAQEFISHFRIKLSPRNYLKLKKFILYYRKILSNSFRDVFYASFSLSRNRPSGLNSVDIRVSGRQRWSRSVCHINLLDWCCGYHSTPAILVDKVAVFFGHKDVLDILRFNLSVSVHPVTEHVKKIIFDELRTKSAIAENKEAAMKICSQRGDWALMRSSFYNQLKWSLGELEFGESLILWHIATELCFNGNLIEGSDSEVKGNDGERRKFCKIISDYMFYLLVLKPKVMVSVAGNWKAVFHDTCADARSFFLTKIRNRTEACKKILLNYGNMPPTPRRLKDYTSKSVLDDARVLAKRLQDLQAEQWKLMSQVWVEMLSYAAYHCEAEIHAQQPSQGGELVTFVWLLMNHLGFGKQVME